MKRKKGGDRFLKKFYDTNALLKLQDKVFQEEFAISSVTLRELEDIKTSGRKDEKTKYEARNIVRLLAENHGKFEVIPSDDSESTPNDIKICQAAERYNRGVEPIIFITYDLCCRYIAEYTFNLAVEYVQDESDEYCGFREVVFNEEEMAYFYEHLSENSYGLLTNEYLLVKTDEGCVVDAYRWNGQEFVVVKSTNIKSDMFGSLKPYHGDIYQRCAIDSFINNKLTLLKGDAGTGKSYLALSYLVSQLEKHKIDKIVCFTNTVPTINSARLGFYPGTRDEKLLESNIGNMLASKFGDSFYVNKMISEAKLLLLPMCDIRGYDTTGMNCGVYVTEAQNLDVSLMKLLLQRIGEDSVCIIEGDARTQVDMAQYDGANNGMRRLSQVFRGAEYYGEVELKNIYRSDIARRANDM